jgi:hypothetical protein
VRDESDHHYLAGGTQRDHARIHMSRMSVDIEDARAIRREFLPAFGNARPKIVPSEPMKGTSVMHLLGASPS